jgi:cell wall-associated NlpC family hydrolase
MILQRSFRCYLLAMAISLGLAGCASSPQAGTAHHSTGATDIGSMAASVALQQVGKPYRYGGNSPSGFDCSGLIHYSYARVGQPVPRTTGQLWKSMTPVPEAQMRAGDLLFFSIDGKMAHVGLYLGEQQFVHAPQSGRRVEVRSLESPFYAQAFVRAGRP